MEASIRTKSKILALMMVFILMAAALAGCGGSSSSSGNSSEDSDNTVTAQSAEPEEITFDTPFEFDDLTITFGSAVTVTTLDNQYSEHNGKTVIAIPVTITNNSSSTKGLNMFYFKAFDPSGTEIDNVSSYFMDDDIAWAGDARSGATIETTMHFLYSSPGDYFIEFDNYKENVEVRLPLSV